MLKKSLLFCLFFAATPSTCLKAEDISTANENAQTKNFLSAEDLKTFQDSLSEEEINTIREFFTNVQNLLETSAQSENGLKFAEILSSRGIAADYVINVLMHWPNQSVTASTEEPATQEIQTI